MSDRVEKSIELRAPIDRVWRALTDPAEFGEWFRVKLEGAFVVGELTRGKVTYPGYEDLNFEARTARMDKPRLFSFTWHPYAVDPAVDYSKEAPTLVDFRLEPTSTGTRLSILETGFNTLPDHRRADAFRMNDSGWTQQTQNIRAHVET